jgi:hypothetical protein
MTPVLRDELGAPRRLRRLASSPRSRVWRAEVSGTPVVVKQLVDGPQATDRYTREVTALTLAARVDPPVAPRLLGIDPDAHVLVLEWVAPRRAGAGWLVDYAEALARLHAATGTDDVGVLPAWSGPTCGDVDAFLVLAQALGVAAPPGVRAELDGLLRRLACSPGHALLHGDPCPGNDLHTASGVRFVDFEQAALGDGLVELAYLRMGFPTCWCVTAPPPPLLSAAQVAYRAAWRRATGAGLPGDLTDACASWLLRGDALVERARRGTADHLARIPRRDWRWGTATARERLAHRVSVVAATAAPGGELGEFGRLAAAMRDAVHTRWPSLTPLPAQRPG